MSERKSIFLKENTQWQLLQKQSQHQPESPNQQKLPLLTVEALRQHDILTGAVELRQFSCKICERQWWAHVLKTKLVSECKVCHIRYDALECKDEFGIGRFICLSCRHVFHAWCSATDWLTCYTCLEFAGPPYINPRFKAQKKARPESEVVSTHKLIHKIRNYSTVHDSTGSTEATFINQNLGPDIVVWKHEVYAYQTPAGPGVDPIPDHVIQDSNESSSSEEEKDSGEEGDDADSTAGEIGDVEEDFDDKSIEAKETDKSRRKKKPISDSDSESLSDDDEKQTVKSSEDSGIGTSSRTGTGSEDTGSSAAVYSDSKLIFGVIMYVCHCGFSPKHNINLKLSI